MSADDLMDIIEDEDAFDENGVLLQRSDSLSGRSRTATKSSVRSTDTPTNKQPEDETNLRLEDKISFQHLRKLEDIYENVCLLFFL